MSATASSQRQHVLGDAPAHGTICREEPVFAGKVICGVRNETSGQSWPSNTVATDPLTGQNRICCCGRALWFASSVFRFFKSATVSDRWPPRNRSLAQARAVPGRASDRRFPEPTTLVALSRSGLCVGSQDSGPRFLNKTGPPGPLFSAGLNPQFGQLGRSSVLVSAGELHVRSGVQGL